MIVLRYPNRWIPSPTLICFVFTALLLCCAGSASAQTEGRAYYSRLSRFRIPFQVDPGDRRVTEVVLYASENLGKSYREQARSQPEKRGFNFEARRDGWYWFIVQTIDEDKKRFPPRVEGEPAGLRVFVDTAKPRVDFRKGAARRGEISVQWDITDDTLDLDTLRVEYRGKGDNWVTRAIEKRARGSAAWSPRVRGPIEVRLEVRDKAGNVALEDLTFSETGELIRGGGTGAAQSDLKKVNSKTVRLNYRTEDVGPSGISVIEVWMTKGTSMKWNRYPQDANKKPPYDVTVQEEGLYGFTLLAKSGVGLGERSPRPGDQPDIWVEVDTTKPSARLDTPVVGRGQDTGKLTITWSATDKNLARRPITLSYRENQSDRWVEIPGAVAIANTGRYVWQMENSIPFQFYVRVSALDEAGNIGTADTLQPVKVDLSMPRVRVIGVEPGQP